MFRFFLVLSGVFLLVGLISNAANPGECPISSAKPLVSQASMSRLDMAIGFSDKGDLHNICGNFGLLSQVHFFCPAMHWPRSAPFQQQYCYGLCFMVAKKGNVVRTGHWAALVDRDWGPVEGSLGELHSGVFASGWEMNFYGGDWPLMATSDETPTWPRDPGGNPFWPGPWRRDPETGDEVPGEFTSDKDLYCCFDDHPNPRGALGLEVHQSTYSYGRAYASDMLFYRFSIVNTSDSTLQDLYAAFTVVIRVDFDFMDRLCILDGCPDDGDSSPNFVYVWDGDGVPKSPWESLGMMGLALVESPFDLGLTDFHYFDKLFHPTTDEKLWPAISSDPTDPNINPDYYFHGPDVHIDETPPDPGCWDWIVSSGPFDLAPSETTTVAIAMVAGNDSTDLLGNVRTVFKMKEKYYQGPKPPPAPIVHSTSGDGWVRLWWDSEPSETTLDLFTGELDFEGYKIYRSDDGGRTWGEEITDEQGRVVGYVPIAIFDKIDGIKGPDPAYQYQSLGNDVGVKHSFTDTEVINGVEYWYCVTAYDQGNQDPAELLSSLETSMGRPRDPYVISARPGTSPEGWVGGHLPQGDTLTSLDWLCDGLAVVEVLDPSLITGHTYELTFDTLKVNSTVFTLVDVTESDTLFLYHELPDPDYPDGLSPVDGFRLILKNVQPGVKSLEWTEVKRDTSTFDWFTEDRGGGPVLRIGHDDFRITIDRGAQIPAEVHGYVGDATVRDTFYLPLRAELVTNRDLPVPVSRVIVIDPWYYFPDTTFYSPPGWNIEPGGPAWNPYRGDEYPDELGFYYYHLDPVTQETLSVSAIHLRTQNGPESAISPSDGDQFTIDLHTAFFHPVYGGGRYRFTTAAPHVDERNVDLSKIKVVPNPYIVQAGWERESYAKQLMFTHLPQKCTIWIYNVAGEHIATLHHGDDTGYEFWNLRSKHGLEVAYGLYIYLVETSQGESWTGKFAIIK